jgi:hypothetical protein
VSALCLPPACDMSTMTQPTLLCRVEQTGRQQAGSSCLVVPGLHYTYSYL